MDSPSRVSLRPRSVKQQWVFLSKGVRQPKKFGELDTRWYLSVCGEMLKD